MNPWMCIQEHADVEWKFARCKLWMSYFEDGGTVPPPFNIIPTPKSVGYLCSWFWRKFCGHSRSAKKEHLKTIRRKARQASERDLKYQSIMTNLVRRYLDNKTKNILLIWNNSQSYSPSSSLINFMIVMEVRMIVINTQMCHLVFIMTIMNNKWIKCHFFVILLLLGSSGDCFFSMLSII